MQRAQIYIVKTPAGNYKAYALGYADDYNGDPNETQYYHKTLPDQPLRGYGSPEEAASYITQRFSQEHQFDEWAVKEAGDGNLLTKSTENWQVFSWPGRTNNRLAPQQIQTQVQQQIQTPMPAKKRKTKIKPEPELIEEEYEEDELEEESEDELEPEPIPTPKVRKQKKTKIQKRITNKQQFPQQFPVSNQQFAGFPQTNGNNPFTNFQQQNSLSHDQYRQIVDGVVQVFENTLMTAMSYNMFLNSITLAHAYRSIKLMNVLQFIPALEAARIAASHDNTWINLRDAIIQANRMIGINI